MRCLYTCVGCPTTSSTTISNGPPGPVSCASGSASATDALLLHDVEREHVAARADRALLRVRAMSVLEGGAVEPVLEVLGRAPARVHVERVAAVGRAQQLERLEPRHLRDLAGPVGEPLHQLVGVLGRNSDGIDPNDTHAAHSYGRTRPTPKRPPLLTDAAALDAREREPELRRQILIRVAGCAREAH